MSSKWREQIVWYFKGLLYIYLADLIFTAIDWIQPGTDLTFRNLLIPAVIALLTWSILFILVDVLRSFTEALADVIPILVLFIIVGMGYCIARLSVTLLPEGWVVFKQDGGKLFVLGLVYGLIAIFSSPDEENAKEPIEEDV